MGRKKTRIKIYRKCENCNVDLEILINPKDLKAQKVRRFCNVHCMDEWQRKVPWEEIVGLENANKIRIERSIQVSGDNNPSKNPDVATKISKSLKKYIKENNARTGKRNAFYGRKHTEEFKLNQRKNKKGK